MEDEIILKTENLHKIYAEGTSMEVHALQGVNIEIKKVRWWRLWDRLVVEKQLYSIF